MIKSHTFLAILLLGTSLFSNTVYAAINTDVEINHLLNFISNSGCQFIRNGTEYSVKDARKHIEKKYKYFKSQVNTTEDFIKYTATKSSMTGELYQVRCDKVLQASGQWLTKELELYRSKNSSP